MTHRAYLSKILSSVSLILGLWLLLSPGILGYNLFDAAAQQIIIGSIIVLVAGVRLSLPNIHWPSWISVLLSVELIVIPLNVGVINSGAMHWNTTIIGFILLAVSLWSTRRERTHFYLAM
jgi:hypothetical protein